MLASSILAMKVVLGYAGVDFIAEREFSRSGGEGVRFSPAETPLAERLRWERDEFCSLLDEARREQPEDATVQRIRRRSAARAASISMLEKKIAELDGRIARVEEW